MFCRKWYCFCQKETGHNYCKIHLCVAKDCTNSIDCDVHVNQRCQYIKRAGKYSTQCRNIRLITDGLRYKYCPYHTCKTDKCILRVNKLFGPDTEYCYHHECRHYRCKNKRMGEQRYCPSHIKEKIQTKEVEPQLIN